jgi:hypothetical protein
LLAAPEDLIHGLGCSFEDCKRKAASGTTLFEKVMRKSKRLVDDMVSVETYQRSTGSRTSAPWSNTLLPERTVKMRCEPSAMLRPVKGSMQISFVMAAGITMGCAHQSCMCSLI